MDSHGNAEEILYLIFALFFCSGTFSELPLFLWPVALVLVVVLVLVARGYHLGLGYGLISIAPSTNGTPATDPNLAIGGYPDSTRPSIAQVSIAFYFFLSFFLYFFLSFFLSFLLSFFLSLFLSLSRSLSPSLFLPL